MMMKITLFLILFFISFSFFVSATLYPLKEYSSQGFSDQMYSSIEAQSQNILFNSNYLSTYGAPIYYVRNVVANQMQSPIYADLGSGDFKIFAASANSILVYQDKTLQLNQTLTFENLVQKYKVFSFDNVTYLVVIDSQFIYPVQVTPIMTVLKYNNSAFEVLQKRNFSDKHFYQPDPLGDDMAVECNGDRCVMAVMVTGSTAYQFVKAAPFNLTAVTNDTLDSMELGSIGSGSIKTSKPFEIVSKDIDSDGLKEFMTAGSNGADMRIFTGRYLDNGTLVFLANSSIAATSSSGFGSNLVLGSFNTGSISTMAVSYKDTNNKIRMMSMYWSGTNWVKYSTGHSSSYCPAITAMSNTFLCKVFTNDNEANYCVLGYTNNNATVMMAATDFGVGFLETDTVTALGTNFTNYFIPDTYTMQILAHGINTNNNIQSGIYITDFMTPFGIYSISQPNYFTGTASLNLDWSLPHNIISSIITPVRAESSPYYDILAESASSLIYIDDKFISPNAEIDAYTINPCVNQPFLLNTSVQITVTPKSYNDIYNVAAKAILYYGNINEQAANFTAFFPSGSTMSFDFIANKSITNGKIRLETKDDNNNEIEYIDIPFSVSTTGNAFGTCLTSVSDIIATNLALNVTADLYDENVTMTDNFVRKQVTRQANSMGIPTLLFVLLILFGADFIIFVAAISNPTMAVHTAAILTGILFFDLFGLIIGTMIGIVPVAFMVTLIIILVIIGAMYLANFFNKTTSS
jgi:hypothetical protein